MIGISHTQRKESTYRCQLPQRPLPQRYWIGYWAGSDGITIGVSCPIGCKNKQAMMGARERDGKFKGEEGRKGVGSEGRREGRWRGGLVRQGKKKRGLVGGNGEGE